MMYSKVCSCGGSNENCCGCFGAGVITRRRKKIRPSTIVVSAQKTAPVLPTQKTAAPKKTPRQLERCPCCRVVGQPSVWRDHIDLAHSVTKARGEKGLGPRKSRRILARFDRDYSPEGQAAEGAVHLHSNAQAVPSDAPN